MPDKSEDVSLPIHLNLASTLSRHCNIYKKASQARVGVYIIGAAAAVQWSSAFSQYSVAVFLSWDH